MIGYLCKSLRIISLVWPTRLIFLAMGEVLSFGFNLAVSFPSGSRGSVGVKTGGSRVGGPELCVLADGSRRQGTRCFTQVRALLMEVKPYVLLDYS